MEFEHHVPKKWSIQQSKDLKEHWYNPQNGRCLENVQLIISSYPEDLKNSNQ